MIASVGFQLVSKKSKNILGNFRFEVSNGAIKTFSLMIISTSDMIMATSLL